MKKLIFVFTLIAAACGSAPARPPVTTPDPPTKIVCNIPSAASQCNDIYQQEVGRDIQPDELVGCLAQFHDCVNGGVIRQSVFDSPAAVQHRLDLENAKLTKLYAPLTVDGHIFRDGADPWRWRGVSAFKQAKLFEQHALALVDGFLDDFKGYNLLRVWDYTPVDKVRGDGRDWEGEEWESTPADQWVAYAAYVGNKGWRLEITLLTDDDPARIEPAKRLVHALVDAKVTNIAGFECGNEPLTHKHIDCSALRETLEWAKRTAGIQYTSGVYEDSREFYGSYGVFHSSRDEEWPRRAHDALDYYVGGGPNYPEEPAWRMPWVCDEPAKWQDVLRLSGRPEEDDAAIQAVMRDYRAHFGACALLGGGATYHFENGKFARRPTEIEKSFAAAALSGLTAFPADAPNGPYSRPDDDSLRTYIVGDYMVRVRPTTPNGPRSGVSLDPGGVLWRIR